MLRVRAAELLRVRLPLVHPFRSAHGTVGIKDALLVRVETDAGIGYGECVAQSEPTYAPDTIDSARLVLREHLLPRALAGVAFDDVQGNRAARAALECALLDARLQGDGVSLASYLGATRTHIDAGVAIGLCDDEAELRKLIAHYIELGYRRIKCKIEPGHDDDVLRAARAEAGNDIELAADANGSYTINDAPALAAFDQYGLQCLEQPLPTLYGHVRLAPQLRTRICLDETVTSSAIARAAIEFGACGAISVKPGRVGGLDRAVRVHDVCVAADTPALAGGMLETGIGRAALVALAALPGFTLTGDCSASERYFGAGGDLTEPFVLDGGQLRVPDGPGLGVTVRPEQLARYTIARERITAGDA